MKLLTIGEFSEKCGVTPGTIRRWEKIGKIMPIYTPGGHRRYTDENVRELGHETLTERRIVLYCRISPKELSTMRLEQQVQLLKMYALGRGHCDVEVIEEVGDGTDMHRPELIKLIHDMTAGEIVTLIVSHKDRLVPFGFELFEHIAKACDCEVIALNIEDQMSSTNEVVDNLVAIVESFSDRVQDLPTLVAVRS